MNLRVSHLDEEDLEQNKKESIFLTRTCAYQRVRTVSFSEKPPYSFIRKPVF